MNLPKQILPNSSTTLILGILSIMTCCCYGIPGLIFGIIALVLSSKSLRLYIESPDTYTNINNLKVGRICAIIGISLSSVFLVFMIVYLIIVGLSGDPYTDIDFYFNKEGDYL